ncbi:CoB--CoM heterodisulfide reductase iron-sulfur subunit B family protein [Magnetospirillum sp. UT-4]|uniref:CoB--CoM heterodisulfide reductase iron-sulfur subunit B family protein n=1 Tax=Magnetospirillum sp. UT-4 TaxID=2681467 RepID=UPI00137DEDF5|nr:CoB--CoM heterodisulfide reductase iron-sulfur subunit B family protein [Magnetospirillum sp. UT-4]CAA7613940.1 CoB--CoM heterodisulfide reductase [Magnetospirillum sp. UT-4]
MTKTMSYYPGCSSQASAVHLDKSLRAAMSKLGVQLRDVEDWNCCGASVGHIEGGHLGMFALNGRNLAAAQAAGPEDVVTPCAACYLNTHYHNEKIRENEQIKAEVNEALAAGGKSYDGSLHVRHACEVIVNDIGIDKVKEAAVKPLTGLKVAGWVGCQTVRPFAKTERGGMFDTYDDPQFLDDFITACGADAVPFKGKTKCCGGSVSVMSPDKTLHLMKDILDEVKSSGAEVVVTPCPLCQTNLEMYQPQINAKFGTDFNFPVMFYSQLMAVAFGLDGDKDAGLNQHLIPPQPVIARAK